MQKAKSRILETTYIALFAALIAVCAFITIPMPLPFISFTLQTFGVFAALGILGGRDGTTAVAVYILLGAIGVPVFSGFRGGFGVLIGPTGGYIAGFLGAALVYWLLTARKNTTARVLPFRHTVVCFRNRSRACGLHCRNREVRSALHRPRCHEVRTRVLAGKEDQNQEIAFGSYSEPNQLKNAFVVFTADAFLFISTNVRFDLCRESDSDEKTHIFVE